MQTQFDNDDCSFISTKSYHLHGKKGIVDSWSFCFVRALSFGWLYLNLTNRTCQHLLLTISSTAISNCGMWSVPIVFQRLPATENRKQKTDTNTAYYHFPQHIIFLSFIRSLVRSVQFVRFLKYSHKMRGKMLAQMENCFRNVYYTYETLENALANSVLLHSYIRVYVITKDVRIETNKLNHKQTWHMANEMKITHFLWCHIVGSNFFHSNCFTFNPNRNSRMNGIFNII